MTLKYGCIINKLNKIFFISHFVLSNFVNVIILSDKDILYLNYEYKMHIRKNLP